MPHCYRDYQPIAVIDLTRGAHPCLWLITWDPAEGEATRPLAIQKDGTWYCYGLDITKNVWEVFGSSGYIRTVYDYTPYGGVTEEGDVAQPVQWSSEMYDAELAMVYYNFRHYNPMDGRWINRDPIAEEGGWNLYVFAMNNGVHSIDALGKRLLPVPQEAIFLYPYVEATTKSELLGFVTKEQVNNFYTTIADLSKKQDQGKKCYKIYILAIDAADVSLVTNKKCDIKFIVGHGKKVDSKDYVK